MKIRSVKTHRQNNTVTVEGKTVNSEEGAARAAFVGGASEMARLFRERIEVNDLRGLVELAAATKTKSFYGEQ